MALIISSTRYPLPPVEMVKFKRPKKHTRRSQSFLFFRESNRINFLSNYLFIYLFILKHYLQPPLNLRTGRPSSGFSSQLAREGLNGCVLICSSVPWPLPPGFPWRQSWHWGVIKRPQRSPPAPIKRLNVCRTCLTFVHSCSSLDNLQPEHRCTETGSLLHPGAIYDKKIALVRKSRVYFSVCCWTVYLLFVFQFGVAGFVFFLFEGKFVFLVEKHHLPLADYYFIFCWFSAPF